jgi:hypothetical protein
MDQEEPKKRGRGRPRKYPIEEKKERERGEPLTGYERLRLWRERHPDRYDEIKRTEVARQRERYAKRKEAKHAA